MYLRADRLVEELPPPPPPPDPDPGELADPPVVDDEVADPLAPELDPPEPPVDGVEAKGEA